MRSDLIDLMFGGMAKLGPGDDAETVRALKRLPKETFGLVVDAGCGAGRQTLTLARALGVVIHAVDAHLPFLEELERHARDAHLPALVKTYHMDMRAIAGAFHGIDLLWSEGAAYNIGFEQALTQWAPVLSPDGCAVVSELTWLTDAPPAAVRAFFQDGYPDMRSLDENIAVAARAGYTVLDTRTLPPRAWGEGYYDVLAPRAKRLLDHASDEVRTFAAETLKEIEIFHASAGSYGYVMYLLQRALPPPEAGPR